MDMSFPIFERFTKVQFISAGRMYGGNGHIAFDIPAPDCVVEERLPGKTKEGVLNWHESVLGKYKNYVPVSELHPIDYPTKCEDCGGSGKHEETTRSECSSCNGTGKCYCICCEDTHDCKKCRGVGSHTRVKCLGICKGCNGEGQANLYKIGESVIAFRYAKILFDLPQCKICVPKTNNKVMAFTFDGGTGILVPLLLPEERFA